MEFCALRGKTTANFNAGAGAFVLPGVADTFVKTHLAGGDDDVIFLPLAEQDVFVEE